MKGFSAVEILIVLSIVGILAALAVAPSTMLTDKTKFENAQSDLQNVLQQARNWARARQECVTITLAGSSLKIQGFKPAPLPCAAAVVNPINIDPNTQSVTPLQSGSTVSPFTLKSGAAVNPLIFNSVGGTDYNSTVSVTITLKTFSNKLQILPILGQVIE